MKVETILRVVGLIFWTALTFGIIEPALISAKSNIGVGLGFTFLVGYVLVAYLILKPYIKKGELYYANKKYEKEERSYRDDLDARIDGLLKGSSRKRRG